jgi:hypothetical protein
MASFVHASVLTSALTTSQISAIVGLLQSFNADPSVIANVESNLGVQSAALQSPSVSCLTLTSNLSQGSTDADTQGQVTKLQQFLGITPTTGYFGVLTQGAVEKYQTARGIVSSGTPATTGYGATGPRTRAAMASCAVATTDSTSSNPSTSPTSPSSAATSTARITPIVSSPASGGGGGGGGGGSTLPAPASPAPAPITYSISGFVWLDANGDHKYTSGEMKMPGRIVTLSQNGSVIQTTTTDATGTYTFNVPAGTYRVDHSYAHFTSTGALCDGVFCSSDHSVTITITSTSREIDFGMSLPSPCSVTLRDFGAMGDGQADDTQAIGRALATGCAVSGENLSYKITDAIRPPSNTNFSNATLVQAIPVTGLIRDIYADSISNISLTNIHINRGSDPSFAVGPTTDAYVAQRDIAGIWISQSTNVTLTDVEVYGDGVGNGILLAFDTHVHLVRPYVHDMQWASTLQPDNEVLIGIGSVLSTDVTVDSPKIANLTPEAIQETGGRVAGSRNNMTDGLDSGGTNGFTVINPDISYVGEGIDISGSYATTNFNVTGGNLHDIDGTCYKSTNVEGPGIFQNSVATRCGLYGYGIGGNVTGVQFINDQAIDTGANSNWPGYGKDGFAMEEAYNAVPSNITFSGDKATDTQTPPNMSYGFYNQIVAGLPQTITFTNSTASGYIEAAINGFASAGTCVFRGAEIGSGASVTAFQQGSVPSGHACVSETRTCTNGVLSGSYPEASCSISTSSARDVFSQIAGAWAAFATFLKYFSQLVF